MDALVVYGVFSGSVEVRGTLYLGWGYHMGLGYGCIQSCCAVWSVCLKDGIGVCKPVG